MAIVHEEISSYAIRFESGGRNPWTATVFLALLSGGGGAWLRFYPPGVDLPPNHRETDAQGRTHYFVSFPFQSLHAMEDMLRYEKPIYFYFEAGTGYARVTTDLEPIGEEESA